MKRAYAELILKAVSHDNMIRNIVDYLETLSNDVSDDMIDIISGVEPRNKKCLDLSDDYVINKVNEYINKNIKNKESILSISIERPAYRNDHDTRVWVSFCIVKKYDNRKFVSEEDYDKYVELCNEMLKYNGFSSELEEGSYRDIRSKLYNFYGRAAENNMEGCKEIYRIDYDTYNMNL